MVVLSIDHGNGNFKGFIMGDFINWPSLFARLEDVSDEGLKKKDHHLKTYTTAKRNGEKFVWGKDIHDVTKTLSTYGVENRYKDKSYQTLSEFGIAELLPKGLGNTFDNVVIYTGCPSTEKGTKLEEDLIDVYKGGHVVNVNGRDIVINVTKVVVLPQPLGTVAYLYLDSEGDVADESYETSYVGVIDIGSGTTDIDGIKALARQKEDTGTFDIGIKDAYKDIAAAINGDHPEAKATPEKVEAQILTGSDSYKVSERLIIDIKDLKESIFSAMADRLFDRINTAWKGRVRFDKLLLTGGGAIPLAKYFKTWEPDIIVVENPQLANAAGFYRYGLMETRG